MEGSDPESSLLKGTYIKDIIDFNDYINLIYKID